MLSRVGLWTFCKGSAVWAELWWARGQSIWARLENLLARGRACAQAQRHGGVGRWGTLGAGTKKGGWARGRQACIWGLDVWICLIGSGGLPKFWKQNRLLERQNWQHVRDGQDPKETVRSCCMNQMRVGWLKRYFRDRLKMLWWLIWFGDKKKDLRMTPTYLVWTSRLIVMLYI